MRIYETWNGVQWNEIKSFDELPLGVQSIRIRPVKDNTEKLTDNSNINKREYQPNQDY